MPFSEVVGQERPISSLRSALRRGALHHAYLLAGPRGVGKGRTARILAQALECVGSERPDDACGRCAPCRKVERDLHPDVLVLSEERVMAKAGRWEPKGGRTPSREIVVDQVRDLVDRRLSLKRFEGRRRAVIIDPADAMNHQAQNALLKTLEEPPEDTVLLLVASAPDALLPTIRSRCLRLPFAPLPDALVAERLAAAGRSPEASRLAAAVACGSLGRALELDDRKLAERRAAVEAAAALTPEDAGGWIAFAREQGADREAARESCELLLLWLRDVLALQAAGEGAHLALVDLADASRRAASRSAPREIVRRIGRVREALSALRQNASAALCLERMCVGWFHG